MFLCKICWIHRHRHITGYTEPEISYVIPLYRNNTALTIRESDYCSGYTMERTPEWRLVHRLSPSLPDVYHRYIAYSWVLCCKIWLSWDPSFEKYVVSTICRSCLFQYVPNYMTLWISVMLYSLLIIPQRLRLHTQYSYLVIHQLHYWPHWDEN